MEELVRILVWKRLVVRMRASFDKNSHLYTPEGLAQAASNLAQANGILVGLMLAADAGCDDEIGREILAVRRETELRYGSVVAHILRDSGDEIEKLVAAVLARRN